MPRGVYDRSQAKSRTSKSIIKHFAEFCLRDDIATQLESIEELWMLAIELFRQETGIRSNVQKKKSIVVYV